MAENPVRELTERFIQLFLVDEERSITLEVATEAILDKHNDPQTYRCKMRRLTEIARIFTALNLINIDNTADHAFSTGSLYSWRGARGVQERLELERYRNFYEPGERDALLEDIQDLLEDIQDLLRF